MDDPNGSSRGTHNYPSPNAARSHTHFADNLCSGCHSHGWPSSWTGASSSELVYACSRVVQVTDTRAYTPRLLTRTLPHTHSPAYLLLAHYPLPLLPRTWTSALRP